MLVKFISEILKKKELVIIPEFGAIFKIKCRLLLIAKKM